MHVLFQGHVHAVLVHMHVICHCSVDVLDMCTVRFPSRIAMAGEEFFDASSSPLESSTETAAGIAVGAVVGIKRFLDPQPSAPASRNREAQGKM